MPVNYRTAKKRDCPVLAELINRASDGVVEYLFKDLVPGMTPIQLVAHSLKADDYPHTYKSAIVAVDNGRIVGMALSYPSAYHRITQAMRQFFPEDRLRHLNAFFSSRVDNTWYLDALCVMNSHRKLGIGEELISLTKEKSIRNGYHGLSLITFTDNDLALPVYERTGFSVVEKVELNGNEYIDHWEGCFLMNCNITT